MYHVSELSRKMRARQLRKREGQFSSEAVGEREEVKQERRWMQMRVVGWR